METIKEVKHIDTNANSFVSAFIENLETIKETEITQNKTRSEKAINFSFSVLDIGLKISGVEKVVLTFSRSKINKVLGIIYNQPTEIMEKVYSMVVEKQLFREYNKVVMSKLKENQQLLIK